MSDRRIFFRTYGSGPFTNSVKRLTEEANATGWFDDVEGLNYEHLSSRFCEKYSDILEKERGGGYWLWKWDVIKQATDVMRTGDILIYCDSGCVINSQAKHRFQEYIDMVCKSEYDMLSFELSGEPVTEQDWTTEKIFEAFDIEKESPVRTSRQYVGGILVMRKGPHLMRWVELCLKIIDSDHNLITDTYNQEAYNHADFKDNRHDQSISSVARKLLGSVVLKDETWSHEGNTEEKQKTWPFYAARLR